MKRLLAWEQGLAFPGRNKYQMFDLILSLVADEAERDLF